MGNLNSLVSNSTGYTYCKNNSHSVCKNAKNSITLKQFNFYSIQNTHCILYLVLFLGAQTNLPKVLHHPILTLVTMVSYAVFQSSEMQGPGRVHTTLYFLLDEQVSCWLLKCLSLFLQVNILTQWHFVLSDQHSPESPESADIFICESSIHCSLIHGSYK